jgi:hypothetical protein
MKFPTSAEGGHYLSLSLKPNTEKTNESYSIQKEWPSKLTVVVASNYAHFKEMLLKRNIFPFIEIFFLFSLN